MDKGMDRIVEDVKEIVETRTAIADKLEKLEHRFTSTVQEAKTMAEDFAGRTQSMFEDTMGSVKEATDPSRLVSNHPWAVVSGAIIVGFAVGRLLREGQNGVMPYYPPGSQAANVMPSSGEDTTGREGVYPFYPHADEDRSPAHPQSSERSSVLRSLKPVVAGSVSHLTDELIDIGKFALRAWLKELVQKERARPSA
ncbi:MAG: hypothetical protein KF890_04215 [Nitrospira sp.]|nr:hypothetical protein [Nitrospira sp.]